MTTRLNLILGASALLAAAFFVRRAWAASPAPAVGAPAPDFTLQSQEGKDVSLKEFRGRWVVLYFYPKDFTRGCTIEAHNFQRDSKDFEARNAVILGVSTQDAQSHKEFCTKESLSFRLLADTDKKVSKAYGSLTNLAVAAFSSRNTFLIDPQGNIAQRWLGVSPKSHSKELLAALDALQKK